MKRDARNWLARLRRVILMIRYRDLGILFWNSGVFFF
jgi:hypothetical protein